MGSNGRGSNARVWKSVAAECAAALVASFRTPIVPRAGRPARRHRKAVEMLEQRCLLSATPLISEFVAINNTGLTDETGGHPDWLEVYNPGAADANLNGYFLTDDPVNLTKWSVPAVTAPSGGFLTIFADGNNLRNPASPLHTNFSLSGSGGYLALVAPDGQTVLSEYNYPQQVADMSYGVTVKQTVTPLAGDAAASHTLIPTDGSLGSSWINAGFNDSSWISGPTGVGYETQTPQPSLPGFGLRMVDTQGGTDGAISDIGKATSLLNGATAPGAFNVVFDKTVNYTSLNTGDGGFFTGPTWPDQKLPNGTGGSASDVNDPGRTDYALRAVSNVTIPAGQYTIDVSSDDGFRLTIPGVTFTNRNGEEFSGAVNPSPANTLVYGAPRGPANTFATFTVPAGGLSTTLQLDYYEHSGGDELELSLATGLRSSFSTSTFQLLANGVNGWSLVDPTSPPTPNFRSLIGTDVQSAMLGQNNTAYVRIPFNVGDPSDFQDARFQIKYDDGFVAYLNGVQIASRNAPATPAWNSGATADHPDASSLAYESFALPTSALATGSNILAIQGLNSPADQTRFLVYPRVQGLFNSLGTPTYFATPTPGAVNGVSTNVNFIADTKFNFNRGFYTSPFQLTITTATPGATVRYTTDGSEPTATTGTVYTGPITINHTTNVRAAAFKAGYQPTNVDTQSYIFMADVINQEPTGAPPTGWPGGTVNTQIFNYGMNPSIVSSDTNIINDIQSIPSVSITMNLNDLFNPTTGIYVNASQHGRTWERPASVEFLYPNGTSDLHADAGIRMRGGYSRTGSNPKHAFRLFFRSDYGQSSFDFPIMGSSGASSFKEFDLRTFENYSWSNDGDSRFTGLRDQFSRDTQLAMGWQGERGDYYNLYINGQFWGIYNTDERITKDYGATYFGGNADNYDVVKVAADQGYIVEAGDGNLDAWNSLWTQAQGDMTSSTNYQKLLGNNADGSRNVAYPVLLDPNNLADYMLTVYYTGNLDAPLSAFLGEQNPNNYYAIRDRTGNMGFQFFTHDAEHTFLDVNENRIGPNSTSMWPITTTDLSKSNPQWLFEMLMANPEFKLTVADHIQKQFFDGGALTPAQVAARMQVRANQITGAIYGESARWGDAKHTPSFTHADWQTEVNRIFNSYIPQRTGIVINQFRNMGWFSTVAAPVFSQFGGTVPSGYQLTITRPGGVGTIYYTLDGSDPRLPGGAVSPTAQVYSGAITISQTRRVRARILNNGVWSAIEDATFTMATGALKITELMYNPPAPPVGSPYVNDDFQFIELFNSGATDLDMTSMKFSKGVTLTFAPGTVIHAGQRAVVVRNAAAFQSLYGAGVTILGTYTGKLSHSSAEVRLDSATGQAIFDFTYQDSWYSDTDGGGYSLVVRNPVADPSTLNLSTSWRPSNDLNGKPGAPDPGPNPGAVVVNEILTNTDQPGGDWVELYNTTNAAIDISGWFLSDSPTNLRKYQIQPGTIIAAGGYLVLQHDSTFGNPAAPGVNTAFAFNYEGDSVHLSSVDSAGNAGGIQDHQSFAAADPEVTFGRYITSTGSADFTALVAPTPGGANGAPVIGPVVMNELLYNPTTGQEFIELYNTSSQPVPLFDPNNPQDTWQFTDGIAFTFPTGVTIPANGYVLVVGGDPALFRSQYPNVPADVQVFGPYTAADGTNVLSNNGENVALSRPLAPDVINVVPYVVVDHVHYGIAAPWPVGAAGSGSSLDRVLPGLYGNDPASWIASTQTGGSPGVTNFATSAPSNPPSALAAALFGVQSVSLTWQDNSNNEDQFLIERSPSGAANSWTQIATAITNATSYTDGTTAAASTYYYRVRAYNLFSGGSYSAYSNVIPITTPQIGDGLSAAYYLDSTSHLAGTPVLTRVDPQIDSSPWINYAPDPSVGNTNFSARWTGRVQAQFNETYTFTTVSDDGVMLFVNGVQLINNWTNHGPTTDAGIISLLAGQQYNIELDYFQGGGPDTIQLLWASTSTPQQLIPRSQLYSGAAPAIPSNLAAVAASSTQFNLSWKDNSGIETGFDLERKTGLGGTFAPVTGSPLPSNTTSYVDTGLTPGVTYYYEIRALNFAANSAYTAPLIAITPTPPVAPTAVHESAGTTTQISLVWTDNSNNEDGFRVMRGLVGGPLSQIALVGPNVLGYTDNGLNGAGLASGTEYVYEIDAYNVAGSGASASVIAATRTLAPTALSASGAAGQVTLSWSAPSYSGSSAALTYNVYRGTSANGEAALAIATGLTTAAFTDTGLTNGTTYYYKVTAVEVGGESARSNETLMTPSGTPVTPAINPVSAPAPLPEGNTLAAFPVTFTGTAGDAFTASVDFGDGSPIVHPTISGFAFTVPAHAYAEEGAYTLTLAVADTTNSLSSAPRSVPLSVTPVAVQASIGGVTPVLTLGASESLTFSAVNPNALEMGPLI
ncbi:MAG: hypothetical protein JWN51_508, partial [Phycisphaerales bacterium]|nr:hypothetical protein [Phycisphaerales bacterium]